MVNHFRSFYNLLRPKVGTTPLRLPMLGILCVTRRWLFNTNTLLLLVLLNSYLLVLFSLSMNFQERTYDNICSSWKECQELTLPSLASCQHILFLVRVSGNVASSACLYRRHVFKARSIIYIARARRQVISELIHVVNIHTGLLLLLWRMSSVISAVAWCWADYRLLKDSSEQAGEALCFCLIHSVYSERSARNWHFLFQMEEPA